MSASFRRSSSRPPADMVAAASPPPPLAPLPPLHGRPDPNTAGRLAHHSGRRLRCLRRPRVLRRARPASGPRRLPQPASAAAGAPSAAPPPRPPPCAPAVRVPVRVRAAHLGAAPLGAAAWPRARGWGWRGGARRVSARLGAGCRRPEPSRPRGSGPEWLGPDGSHWVLRARRVRPEQAEVWRAAGRRGVLTAGAGPELPSRVDRWAWASATGGTGWPSRRGPDPWGCAGCRGQMHADLSPEER